MDSLIANSTKDNCGDPTKALQPASRDVFVQLALSLILGVSAFVAFCFLRPRWPTLYAARKRRLDPKIGLPTLPNTFFGWIPVLYRITEEQVLASAGLDAFVFLSFFKMAIRILAIMAFFAYVVLLPVNVSFHRELPLAGNHTNSTDPNSTIAASYPYRIPYNDDDRLFVLGADNDRSWDYDRSYNWAYLVFGYFFSGLTLYILNKETFRVIHIRQEYLGTQSTVTDRTFRLSGIPHNMRSEDKIKQLIEDLEIGKVESVKLVCDWREIDSLVEERKTVLAILEKSWIEFLGQQGALPQSVQRLRDPWAEPSVLEPREDEAVDEEAGENGQLLAHGDVHPEYAEKERPKTRIWYGFLKLQSRNVDAIDYYEEKLRRLDDKICEAREKQYTPTDLAFVTMDSIAACQMIIQARIDPRPGQLLTKPAPSPSDIMWANTYAPRGVRRLRSWTVTISVALLTLLWVVVLATIAGLLSVCNFQQWFPAIVHFLENFPTVKALIETFLSTALVSLLNVAVPYLYDYLSYQQGMISKGDVELSIVSKNFFFTFFNIFFVFTVSSTVINVFTIWEKFQDAWGDRNKLAQLAAGQIETRGVFYTNFVMLQGLGLFPFRLLEVGSVFLYPIYRWGAKTPREFAEITQPPIFSYGFYLPTALLVFMLCQIYSTLPIGFVMLTMGLVYFVLGYYTYKYQLLYAMDQPQHATGGAWRLISYRIMLGLVVSEIILSSYLAINLGFVQSVLVIPLIIFTVWYSFYFRRRFEPLTRFIALRSIRAGEVGVEDAAIIEDDFDGPRPSQGLLRRGSTIDEDKEKGMKFVNPSLTLRLEPPWIYQERPPTSDASGEESGLDTEAPNAPANTTSAASDSSVSLGDTHVWRQQADRNR